MRDEKKTKKRLIEELEELRKRITERDTDVSKPEMTEKALTEIENVFRTLYDTTILLADETDQDRIIKVIADRAVVLLVGGDCTVYLIDKARAVLIPIYTNYPENKEAIMGFEIPFGDGVSGRVARIGQPLYLNIGDENDFAIHIPGTDEEGDDNQSVLAVPMFDGDDVLGVLTIDRIGGTFDESDVEKMTVFARQAEIAIKRARYASERSADELHRNVKTRLLDRLRKAITVEECLQIGVETVRDAELYERAIFTTKGEQGETTHYGQVGLDPGLVERLSKSVPAKPKMYERMFRKEFGISNSYFIPVEANVDFEETGRYLLQEQVSPEGPDAWRQGDELFIAMLSSRGMVESYLSVDTPFNGQRPDVATILYLEDIADIVARQIRDIEAFEALRESEERYRSLQANIPVGIFRTTPEGKFLSANEALAEMLRYKTVDELIGIPVADSYAFPEKRQGFINRIEENGIVADFETQLKRKDGTVFWVSFNSRAVIDANNNVIYYDGIVEDITERKHTEKALAQERNMFMVGPVIVFKWRNEEGWPVEYVSPNVEGVFGYTAEEFTSGIVVYADTIPEVDIGRVGNEVSTFSESGTSSFEHEPYRIIRKDGELVWLYDFMTIIRDNEGNITHYLGYIVDITELKKSEEALRESEERYKDLFEASADGIEILDDKGFIVACNAAHVKTLGYEIGEIIGKHTTDFFTKETMRVFKEMFPQLKAKGKAEAEIQLLNRDGALIPIWRKGIAKYDERGGFIGAVNYNRDITERKRAEDVQNVLFNIANSINTCENLADIYPVIHRNLSRVLDTTNFFIALYDKDSHIISVPYYTDEYDEYDEVPAENTNCYYIIRTGEVLLADQEVFADLNARGEIVTKEELTCPLSWLGAPLKRGEEVFGVVGVQSYIDSLAYNENDKELLQIVSHQIAKAIDEARGEEALRDSKKRYKDLFEASADGIEILDDKGFIVACNAAHVKTLGYEIGEIIGKHTIDFFTKETKRVFKEMFPQLKAKGKAEAEIQLVNRDGALIPIWRKGIAKYDERGGFIGAVNYNRDITERKRAEDVQNVLFNIANSINTCENLADIYPVIHRNLSRVLDTTNFFIALYDKDSHTISFPYYVDEYDDYDGYDELPVEGTNCHYVISTGEALFADKGIFADLNARGEITTIEELARPLIWIGAPLKRGDEIFGVVAIQSYTDPFAYNENDKELLQIVSHQIAKAIDEVLTREALRDSEERYRNVVENSGELIWQLDTEGNFVFFNSFAEKLSGQKSIDWQGKHFSPFIHPDELAQVKNVHEEVVAGNAIEYETKIFNIKGEIVDMEVQAIPLFIDGEVTGTLNFGRDITERKRADEQIKASLAEKEVLLKEIHHRVKNNLQIISSLLNLQARYVDDANLSVVFRNSQDRIKAMALIHESLYKSEDLARVNFAEYIQTLVRRTFSAYFSSTEDISLQINVENIYLDINTSIPVALIINELVSNAVQHAFPDGRDGRLVIDFREYRKGEYRLKVADDGVGLPDEFNPEEVPSLGMGLVAALVKQIDGDMEIDGKDGAEFTITFGLRKDE